MLPRAMTLAMRYAALRLRCHAMLPMPLPMPASAADVTAAPLEYRMLQQALPNISHPDDGCRVDVPLSCRRTMITLRYDDVAAERHMPLMSIVLDVADEPPPSAAPLLPLAPPRQR